jgi:hypothetical protein
MFAARERAAEGICMKVPFETEAAVWRRLVEISFEDDSRWLKKGKPNDAIAAERVRRHGI